MAINMFFILSSPNRKSRPAPASLLFCSSTSIKAFLIKPLNDRRYFPILILAFSLTPKLLLGNGVCGIQQRFPDNLCGSSSGCKQTLSNQRFLLPIIRIMIIPSSDKEFLSLFSPCSRCNACRRWLWTVSSQKSGNKQYVQVRSLEKTVNRSFLHIFSSNGSFCAFSA